MISVHVGTVRMDFRIEAYFNRMKSSGNGDNVVELATIAILEKS